MTEYITNFDKYRAQEMDKIGTTENSILELLEQSSKLALAIKAIP